MGEKRNVHPISDVIEYTCGYIVSEKESGLFDVYIRYERSAMVQVFMTTSKQKAERAKADFESGLLTFRDIAADYAWTERLLF